MIPIFNEHDYAVQMNNGSSNSRSQEDKRYYTATELAIYTKWIYWNIFGDRPEDERYALTKNTLVTFCNQLQLHFNENNDYKLIEYCLKKAKTEKIRECNPAKITKREWKQIMSILDEDTRKVYFCCLVLAKFYRNNPVISLNNTKVKNYTDKRFRITQQTHKDILKYAEVKYTNAEKQENSLCEYGPLIELRKLGLLESVCKIKKNTRQAKTSLILCDADVDIKDDDEVYLVVDDFDHPMNYYYYGMNDKHYKKCPKCGRVFKTRTTQNNDTYCDRCVEDGEYQYQYKICIDCGQRYRASKLDRQSCRCDICRKEHRKHNKTEWQKNNRMKDEDSTSES